MHVTTKTRDEAWRLRDLLNKAVVASRFTADLEVFYSQRIGNSVKITTVRVRRKAYCGAHPGPCRAGGIRGIKRATYLEGMDWVGFAALVNDVLDANDHVGNVFSFNRESLCPKYYLRFKGRRRVEFPWADNGRFAHWVQGETRDVPCSVFRDCRGKVGTPVYEDPYGELEGTPGYPGYGVRGEELWLKQMEVEEHEHAH